MIQRIQTLYLLLVVVLTGLALWLPLVDFTVGADTCTLTAFGLKDAAGITLLPTVYLGVVLVAACLVPLVTIFLFKRRLVQIRICPDIRKLRGYISVETGTTFHMLLNFRKRYATP